VAPRSAEAVAVPAVSADFLAASAFPAAVPLLTSVALSPRVLNIRLAYRDLIGYLDRTAGRIKPGKVRLKSGATRLVLSD
jgi:hypothetical protein